MVGRRAIGSGAQEAEHDEAVDAGAPGGLDDRPRAADVDGLVGLVADLAVDPGAMDDGVAARERVGEARVAGLQPMAGPARDDDDVVTGVAESGRKVRPDEPGAAGDRDPHQAGSRADRALRW